MAALSGLSLSVGTAWGSSSSLVAYTNSARASAHLAPLSECADLDSVALQHSADMASQHSLFHSSDLGGQVAGWWVLGENVGMGPTLDDVAAAFLSSAAHRANVLGDYTELGVGVVASGSYVYVTEVFRLPFAAPAAAPTTRPVTSPPSARPQPTRPAAAPPAPPVTSPPSARPQPTRPAARAPAGSPARGPTARASARPPAPGTRSPAARAQPGGTNTTRPQAADPREASELEAGAVVLAGSMGVFLLALLWRLVARGPGP